MARSTNRAKIRERARLYSDQPDTGVVKDDKANLLINDALTELYDMLVAAAGEEFYQTVSTAITTAAGTATYALPTDFYALSAFFLNWGADRIEPVGKLSSVADLYRFNGIAFDEWGSKAFRLRPEHIELFPTPTRAVATILRYVPACPELTKDSTAFDGVNGWDRLVALRVAVEMRMIAGLPAGELAGLYEQEKQRIQDMATERVQNEPRRIRDVGPENGTSDEAWPWRLPPAV